MWGRRGSFGGATGKSKGPAVAMDGANEGRERSEQEVKAKDANVVERPRSWNSSSASKASRRAAKRHGEKEKEEEEEEEEDKENGSSRNSSNNHGRQHQASGTTSSRVAELTAQLEAAKNEAKLAAEIGQELLKQDEAKSEKVETFKMAVLEQRQEAAKLGDKLASANAERLKASEALEEMKAECAALQTRNVALSSKTEDSHREAIKAGADVLRLERQLQEAHEDAKRRAARLKELELREKALAAEAQAVKTASAVSPSPRLLRKRVKKSKGAVDGGDGGGLVDEDDGGASGHSSGLDDDEGDGDGEDGDGAFRTPTNRTFSRLRNTLSTVRADNASSKHRIHQLEGELRKHKLQTSASARQLSSMEQNLSEYQQIARAKAELQEQEDGGAAQGAGLGIGGDDEAATLEALLLRDELERLRKEIKSEAVDAIIRDADLDATVEGLLAIQAERHKAEAMGKDEEATSTEQQQLEARQAGGYIKVVQPRTAERIGKQQRALLTVDRGVGSDDALVFESTDADATASASAGLGVGAHVHVAEGLTLELASPVPVTASLRQQGLLSPTLDPKGCSGPLVVKATSKWALSQVVRPRHWRWKPRVVELRGPRLLFFRNEWDAKPCYVLPIDGTEVRMVRRPHIEDSQSRVNGDGGSGSGSGSGRRTGASKRAKSNKGSAATSSTTNAYRKRASFTTVMHEFHIWHPRRPVVFFSAPSHEDLSRWAEAIQRQSTSVAVRPRRYAAGFLTLVTGASKDLFRQRFFAVLRADGIHMYTGPRKRQSSRVVVVDDTTQIWKPETRPAGSAQAGPAGMGASTSADDMGRTICLSSQEQGGCFLLADTEVDREWWLNSLQAHGMGIVSWGSVQGIRTDVPFGCVDV